MPSRTNLRRAGLLLAVPALALSGLMTTAAPASAVADPDASQVRGGERWLRAQLTGGLVHNNDFNFDDIGLSADIAFGLDAIGDTSTVTTITNAIEPRAEGEWYSFGTSVFAGSLAKALVLAQTAGSDPTDFGGENLVTRLEGLVATGAPITGRIEDVDNSFGDANVIGQAYAAQGLTAAGSGQADEATAFLLQQQCSEGYFRLEFNEDKTEADQTCDGGTDEESPPDTDATALAVLALQSQSGDIDVAAALSDAVDWLLAEQGINGSFGGGPSTEAPNSNSTGLAGWVLGLSGEDTAAGAAADWVADLQNTAMGACTTTPLGGETGAIAYDLPALEEASEDGITAPAEDQWRRASAQALPALQWVTSPGPFGDATIDGPSGFVSGGALVPLTIDGLADGERACLGGFSTARRITGDGAPRVTSVKVPNKTGDRTYRLVRMGAQTQVTLSVLGPLKVPFVLKSSVSRGDDQVVRVSGLEPGESVRVLFRGDKVAAGDANSRGKFTARFKATRPRGEALVKVIGQFSDRSAKKTFTVTR